MNPRFFPVLLVFAAGAPAAERVTAPILFNTPEADAIVSAMQIFPPNNPWHEDVSRLPTIANSEAMIARIVADLPPNRRTLRLFFEMNYVLVPDAQPLVPVRFLNYPDESDLNGGVSPVGRYPIPPSLRIEGWPRSADGQSLAQVQEDTRHAGGDRHAIIVVPGKGLVWELGEAKRLRSCNLPDGAKPFYQPRRSHLSVDCDLRSRWVSVAAERCGCRRPDCHRARRSRSTYIRRFAQTVRGPGPRPPRWPMPTESCTLPGARSRPLPRR